MGDEHHRIRKQRIRVDVDSEALAMALQTRLAGLKRTVFFDAIERALDEYVELGQHVRIAHLKIDLGTIALTGDFEQVVAARLDRELRDALQKAVRAVEHQPSRTQFAHSSDAARLEVLEHYLLGGTLPFWAAASGFNLDAVMADAAAASPGGLVRLLRQHGADTRLLERVVYQLSETGLRHLLQLLDPDRAPRIILALTALTDLAGLTGDRALMSRFPAGKEQARRALWLRVLTCELQEGSAAIDRAALVESLQDGTGDDNERARAAASLAHDAAGAAIAFTRYDLVDILRYYLRYGVLPWGAGLSKARPGERTLSIQAMLDTLPGLPLPLLRTVFPATSSEERLGAVLRAVQEMSEETLGRLLVALFSDAIRPTALADLSAAVERAPDMDAAYARAIVRLLDGWSEEPEAPTAERPPAAEGPSRWDVQLIKSVLVERARTGSVAGPGEPSSETLLQLLVEEHPADARHFFQAIRRAGIGLSSLLSEPASLRLLGRSLQLFTSEAVESLTLALFGPTISTALHQRLIAETERLSATSEFAPDRVADIRATLAPLVEPVSADQGLDAQRIITLLTERARTGRSAGAGEPSSETLLQFLVEEHPADARHFFRAIRRAGIGLSSLLSEAASLRLLGRSLPLFASEAVESLTLALFGPTISTALHQRLIAETERLSATREFAPDRVADIRAALAPFVEPVSADQGLDAQRIITLLTERARTGRGAGAGEPSSAHLLSTLLEELPTHAQRVFRALREAGIRPSTLLSDEASVRLFDRSLLVLAPRARAHVEFLLRVVAALPDAERPGTEAAMRSTILGVVLDRAGEDMLGQSLVAAVLHVLFGGRIPAAAAPDAAAALAWLHVSEASGGSAPRSAHASSEPSLESRGADQVPVAVPTLDRLSDDALRHALVELMDAAPEAVRAVLANGLADRAARERWVRLLAEREVVRIIYLLEPRRHRLLLDATELMFEAGQAVAGGRASALSSRANLWSFLLEFLSQTTGADRSLTPLAAAFFSYVAAARTGDAGAAADRSDVGERLLQAALGLAQRTGNAALRAVLSASRAELLARITAPASPSEPGAPPVAPPQRPQSSAQVPRSAEAIAAAPSAAEPLARPRPVRRRTAFGMDAEEPEAAEEPIHISNAGLVVIAAFLPQLFERLDVLEQTDEGKRRVRPDSLSRLVHLLQYLVDGRTDTPEPSLCLNKLLCGVPFATPIEREIGPTPRERELCDSLLTAVIANWTIISKNTSIAGLRETFLQREGRLEHRTAGWHLQVQRKTVDVLLDRIPWTISRVAHSWMPDPLFVTW